MKKFLLAMLSASMVFAAATAVSAKDNIRVELNGREINFDAEPFIEDGRTLVPIRAITEAMGCDVEWDSASSTAAIKNSERSVYIKIGNAMIKVNDNVSDEATYVALDVPAKIYEDRTYVPLRAVSEAFGADVDWDGGARLVTITYSPADNESVVFSDEAFEYCVRMDLGDLLYDRYNAVYTGNITAGLLDKLERISLGWSEDAPVRSIEDIHKLRNLKTINLTNTNIKDLSPLFDYAGESDVSFNDKAFEIYVRIELGKKAAGHDGSMLREIYLGNIDEDMLKSVTSVTTGALNLEVKSLEDISKLPNLKNLSVYKTENISDYSPISYIKEWDTLNLEGLNIGDDSFLDDINVTKSITFPNLNHSYNVEFENSTYQYQQALSGYRQTLAGLEKLEGKISGSMSDYEKFKTIHDFMALNMEYDMDKYNDDDDYYISGDYYKAYPDILSALFVGGKGVCYDYAQAYSKLCGYFGLECWCIDGECGGADDWENHSWNIVNLDGNYYHVDVTWDDLDDGDGVYYDYFLVSDEALKKDHK